MPDLLDRTAHSSLVQPGDERLARAELRRQIGRLERAAGRDSSPRPSRACGSTSACPPPRSEPRALGLGELEADPRRARRPGRRRPRERSASAPTWRPQPRAAGADAGRAGELKWLRISRDDIGEPGCGHWHSRPRLGPLGMLMGWWRVKVSSGCPLSGRLAAVERQSREAERADERPPAPWGSFPLAELTVLAGLVLLAIGFFSGSPTALGRRHRARRPSAASRSRSASTSPATAPTRRCSPAPSSCSSPAALLYLAGLVLRDLPRRSARSPSSPPSSPCAPPSAAPPAASLQGRRPARLTPAGQTKSESRGADFAGSAPASSEPLAGGQGPEPLVLVQRQGLEELAGAGAAPAALARQQLGQGHALGLPGALRDHPGDVDLPAGDRALQLGPREPDPVGASKRLHVLGGRMAEAVVEAGAIEAVSTRTPSLR